MLKVSIVVPVWNEKCSIIEEFAKRVTDICIISKYDYEVILVDDGSTNGIQPFLESLHFKNRRIAVIFLDRHHGQMKAVWVGFSYASGDVILTIDGDLQYSPEEIPNFVAKIEEGCDAVSGRRNIASINLFSRIFSFCLRVKLGNNIADYGCPFNAMRKEVIKNVLEQGFLVCLKPLIVREATNLAEIGVTYQKRKNGRSKYSFIAYLFFGINFMRDSLKMPKGCYKPEFSIAKILS